MTFAVIFDMDGVLVDSTELIWQAINDALKGYGHHFAADEIRQYLGMSLRDKLAIWKEKYGIDMGLDEFKKKVNEFQFRALQHLRPDTELVKLLDGLRRHKVMLGVGSASGKGRVQKILAMLQIEKYFSVVLGAEDVPEHKPNPHIYLAVAGQLQVPPERCVVIEDAANGIEAARKAGMRVIGLIGRYQTEEDLKDADLLIKGFAELSYEKLRKLIH